MVFVIEYKYKYKNGKVVALNGFVVQMLSAPVYIKACKVKMKRFHCTSSGVMT